MGNFLLSWTFSHFEANQLTVDPATGNVYATDDSSNNQVLEFDPFRHPDRRIRQLSAAATASSTSRPRSPAAPSDADTYVVDTTGRLPGCKSSTPSGNFLFSFGSCGTGDGQFNAGGVGNNTDEIDGPAGMAVDPATGDLYTVDGGNNRGEVLLDSSGDFLSAFGWGVADGASQFETCTSCQAGLSGTGNGQFGDPFGAALNPGHRPAVRSRQRQRPGRRCSAPGKPKPP